MQLPRLLVVIVLGALALPGAAARGRGRSTGRSCARSSSAVTRTRRQHRGIDVGASSATPCTRPSAAPSRSRARSRTAGRALTIQTGDGLSVTLLQLASVTCRARRRRCGGVRVGSVGESADAVTHAPHVHLGVRRTDDEDGYLDPLRFLPAPERVPSPRPRPPPHRRHAPAPAPQPAQQARRRSPRAWRSLPLPSSSSARAAPLTTRRPWRASGPDCASRACGGQQGRWRRRCRAVDRRRDRRVTDIVASAGSTIPSARRADRGGCASRSRTVAVPAARAPWCTRRVDDDVNRHAGRTCRASAFPTASWTGRSRGRGDSTARAASRASAVRSRALGAFASLALALTLALMRAPSPVRRKARPIIADGETLLPDHTDLLRQLDPAHRARVHDDRADILVRQHGSAARTRSS
jgi:hypothetical protein